MTKSRWSNTVPQRGPQLFILSKKHGKPHIFSSFQSLHFRRGMICPKDTILSEGETHYFYSAKLEFSKTVVKLFEIFF